MADIVAPSGLNAASGAVVDPSGPLVKAWPDSAGRAEKTDIVNLSSPTVATSGALPQVVVYQHIDFGGFSEQTSLNYFFVGNFWNDQISSIVVLSGTWRFYEHFHYEGRYWDLSTGQYRWVEGVGIPNDTISSFQLISY